MKKSTKVFSLLLAVVMMLSLCTTAFAAGNQVTNTEKLISEIAKTGKLHAKLTTHSYDNKTDKVDMDFYDDFASDTICMTLNDKGIKVIYSDGNVDCIFTRFFFKISASLKKLPFLNAAVGAVDTIQGTLKSFVDDPHLDSFNKEVSTVSRGGKTLTKERFVGKLLTVSGTFYYNDKGELCELELTDTLGESIGFTVEDVTTTFDEAVFAPLSVCIDLSFVLKLFSIFKIG